MFDWFLDFWRSTNRLRVELVTYNPPKLRNNPHVLQMCSQALTCPDNSHYNICTDTMILLNQIFWGFLVAAESQTCVLSHNRSGWWPEAVKLQKDRESSLYDFCIIFQVFQIHTIALCKDPDPYSLNCAWTVWSPFTSNACKKSSLDML